jgi:hypothetical protein
MVITGRVNRPLVREDRFTIYLILYTRELELTGGTKNVSYIDFLAFCLCSKN